MHATGLQSLENPSKKVRSRRARAEDASFLAWAMLAASRGSVGKGSWDLFLPGSEQESIAFLAKLVLTDPPHTCHWSNFTIAEIDRTPVSALCGYQVGQFEESDDQAAMTEAARAIGWTWEQEIAAYERTERLVPCYPEALEGMWVLENIATVVRHRGRGAAGLLMGEAVKQARQAGGEAVQIQVALGNSGAKRLYQRMGFVPFEEIPSETLQEMLGYPGIRRYVLDLRPSEKGVEEPIVEKARRMAEEQKQRSEEQKGSQIDHREKVQGWLDGLGAEKKVELKLDENGACAFSYENVHCELQLLEATPTLCLISPLVEVPQGTQEELLTWLLEQNYRKANTRGAFYAIDPEYKRVVLIYEYVIGEADTEEEFVNTLGGFLQAAEDCQRDLLQGGAGGEEKGEPAEEMPKNVIRG